MVPGFYVNDPVFAVDLLSELGRPEAKLLFDTFHAAMTGVDPLGFVRDHFELIGHIHVADHPGRHEPGTGTIDFPAIFGWLDDLGYAGWVGCEYKPLGSSAESLGWLRSLRV